jgi:hypothetical protein
MVEEVEDPAYVRMSDLTGENDLPAEPFDRFSVHRDLWTEGLQGHGQAKLEILRFVYLPGSPSGDESHNAEAARQEPTWQEGRSMGCRYRGGHPLSIGAGPDPLARGRDSEHCHPVTDR